MLPRIPAIDVLYCPSLSPAVSGLAHQPCFEPVATMLARMDQAGVGTMFLTQCKKWSCDRRWMCVDTPLDDIVEYTSHDLKRFCGLAGYNPFAIHESLDEVERAVRQYGFRGVFVHPESFGLRMTNARMYPLYEKCVELEVPLVVQFGPPRQLLVEGSVSATDLLRITSDFFELDLLLAPEHMDGWEQYIPLLTRRDTAWMVVSPERPQAEELLRTDFGPERCLWGSSGIPWAESLWKLREIGLDADVEARVLHDNAVNLFRLNEKRPVGTPLAPLTEPVSAE